MWLKFSKGTVKNATVPLVRVSKDEEKNKIASYAYEYSGFDKDFVLLLNSENQKWELKNHLKANGSIGVDFGICGVNSHYHPELYEKVAKGDWQENVKVCHELYKKGTKFYGWNHRIERGGNVIFNN